MSNNKKICIAAAVIVLCLLAVLYYKFYWKGDKLFGPDEQEKITLLTQPSVEAEGEYKNLIEKYAQETQALTIGQNCQMDPLVIKFKGDSTLVIANNDSKEHVISFENQNFFGVSAGDKRKINIKQTFGLTEGVWRYRCGDLSSEQNVGVMYLSQ